MPIDFSKIKTTTNAIEKVKPMTDDKYNVIRFDDLLTSIEGYEPTAPSDCWIGLDYWDKDTRNFLATDEELTAIQKFIEFVGAENVPHTDRLFRLAINKDLMIDRFYEPAIFANADKTGLILLVGDNTIPVAVNGRTFTVGKLSGTLTDYSDKSKVLPMIEFIADTEADAEGWEFKVPLRVKGEKGADGKTIIPTKEQLIPKLKKLPEFVAMVLPVPSGGSMFVPVTALGECEILIKNISETASQFGTRFTLEIDHDLTVISNTSLEKILSKSHLKINQMIQAGESMTLKVWDIQTNNKGNLFAQAKIFNRTPNPDLEYLAVQSQRQLTETAEPSPPSPVPFATEADVINF